ncbi:transposase [Clostridium sp. 'deep sea']|uniref:transposase n=1 Tax=Clostridium sp. 'deep sea' TaxID=2779445 RepID=UPI0018967280|nr:transposase [Clostridium sp. 'deep sea']QOR35030.1 transposase [Clostridium sp. 'deep sea']
MARRQRLHYNGALYHVITRGNNKDNILLNNEDKHQYIKRIQKYISKYNAKIFAYAIMDNHCHLLMQVSEVPLGKVMQLIQQTYTAYYNKKYNRSGHVFEQRYKSILVDKDEYLLVLIKYIHNNPVKAQISDINYMFSSHKEYSTGIASLCSIDEALSLLDSNKDKAIKRYLRFMQMNDDIKPLAELDYLLNVKDYDIDLNERFYITKFFNKIKSEFEEKYNIDCDVLKGKHYKPDLRNIRNEFVIEVIKNKAMKQVELADYLGISHHAISKIVNK